MKRDRNYIYEYLSKREKIVDKNVEKDNSGSSKYDNIKSVRLNIVTGEETDSHK